MIKLLKTIKEIILWIWQMPQNLLGLILLLVYKPDLKCTASNGNIVYFSKYMPGGISLGKYSIIDKDYYTYTAKCDMEKTMELDVTKHEALGHGTQSRILGPLYLPVVGLQSIIWAWIYPSRRYPYTKNGYYKFWTEKWADKLAGVVRS